MSLAECEHLFDTAHASGARPLWEVGEVRLIRPASLALARLSPSGSSRSARPPAMVWAR